MGLARGLQLLPEGLSLRGELPRDVDALGVARDLRDLGREVRVALADRVARDLDATGGQDLPYPVGQALRVGLLVVDDVDPLPLQLLGHPVGDRRALCGVARHGAEEVPAPV